jgi:hypothetical protein
MTTTKDGDPVAQDGDLVAQVESQCATVLQHLDQTSNLLGVLEQSQGVRVTKGDVKGELSRTATQMAKMMKMMESLQKVCEKGVSQTQKRPPEDAAPEDAEQEKLLPPRKHCKAGKWVMSGGPTGTVWASISTTTTSE